MRNYQDGDVVHRLGAAANASNLHAWRSQGDALADACVAQLGRLRPEQLLQAVEARAQHQGGVYQGFLEQCYSVPAWVDFQQIQDAQRWFARIVPLHWLVLLCGSLVEGYAFDKIVHVLTQTERLNKDATRRVVETTQMLHRMLTPDGMQPGGCGHRTLMEVRLLHASMRTFIESSGRWQTSQGVRPINQQEMIGTIIAFDYLVVRGVERLGLVLSNRERQAVHHLWRYAGYLLGVDSQLLTTSWQQQQAFTHDYYQHLYNPTASGAVLANSVLTSVAERSPFHLSLPVLQTISRHLIGDSLANQFGFQSSPSGQMTLGMIRTFTRCSGVLLRHLPDPALVLIERLGLLWGDWALRLWMLYLRPATRR